MQKMRITFDVDHTILIITNFSNFLMIMVGNIVDEHFS